jgi:serine protease Do
VRRVGVILTFVAAAAASGAPTAAAAEDIDAALAEVQLKIVKLYGAGGYQRLDAYGTGFLVSAGGHVVTSWGPLLDADPVTAVLSDGRRLNASLVGADPDWGLAVLKLAAGDAELPHFNLGEAVNVGPGDRILAFSNMFRVAAGDEPVSVMHGIVLAETPVSARRGRFDVNLDTAVYVLDAVTNNPGAAGGVIVTLDGRLAGMIGRELRSGDSETWLNYALPAAMIGSRVESMLSGEIAAAGANPRPSETVRRPVDIGLVMVPDVTVRTPAYTADVVPGSVAEAVGLRREDLIVFVNGSAVRSIRELTAALSAAEPGDELTLVVRREGRLETVRLRVP